MATIDDVIHYAGAPHHSKYEVVRVSESFRSLTGYGAEKGAVGVVIGEPTHSPECRRLTVLFFEQSARLVRSNYIGQCAADIPFLNLDYI